MPKVSDEHKDAVRRRIMDAALTCLLRNGFRDVTTRELLAEAQLSTGTFYNYFPSKEHLYEALAEDLLSADVARITAGTVVSAGSDGASDSDSDRGSAGGSSDVGQGLLRFLADYALVDPEAAVAVSTFRGRMDVSGDAADAVNRLNRFVVQEFTPLVEKAQADGFLRDDLDAPAVVELLDLIWDGLGRRAATGTFQTSYERIGAVVLQLLMSGALGPAASPDELDTRPRERRPRDPRYTR